MAEMLHGDVAVCPVNPRVRYGFEGAAVAAALQACIARFQHLLLSGVQPSVGLTSHS